jgi:hypothetical protein
MICSIEQKDGTYKVVEAGSPVCGKDFCDQCGDCLACYYSDDACNGGCSWVLYRGQLTGRTFTIVSPEHYEALSGKKYDPKAPGIRPEFHFGGNG